MHLTPLTLYSGLYSRNLHLQVAPTFFSPPQWTPLSPSIVTSSRSPALHASRQSKPPQAPSSPPLVSSLGKAKRMKPNQVAPPPFPPISAPPPSYPSPATPPPSHPGPVTSSACVRVPRFGVKWSPMEIISCDFRWSFGDFIEASDNLTEGGFVARMGYSIKLEIMDRGSFSRLRMSIGSSPEGPKGPKGNKGVTQTNEQCAFHSLEIWYTALSTCEQEDFRSPTPHSDEAEHGILFCF